MNAEAKMYDVVIIGAGAAGLMAAREAGLQGKKVALLEHSQKIGEKIRISGGGRCNFTNLNINSSNYLSKNKHFIKSALASYSQHDFIALVESHRIAYHEKTLGQLFCDGSSGQIINLFINDCKSSNVSILTGCLVSEITKTHHFTIKSSLGTFESRSLIIATGGLSIPKIGATDFGYRIAKQFGLKLISTQPALVPLNVGEHEKKIFTSLSGVSAYADVSYENTSFKEAILFTHQGMSGPAILQISSYLESFSNQTIQLNLLPSTKLYENLLKDKKSKQTLANYLKELLPNRLIDALAEKMDLKTPLTDLSNEARMKIATLLHEFPVSINGSQGYQKAEVTRGGVNTDYLSSKTMECKHIPGLFFIGEVVDVTGWLGGYNFQWAWSSGYVAGRHC